VRVSTEKRHRTASCHLRRRTIAAGEASDEIQPRPNGGGAVRHARMSPIPVLRVTPTRPTTSYLVGTKTTTTGSDEPRRRLTGEPSRLAKHAVALQIMLNCPGRVPAR